MSNRLLSLLLAFPLFSSTAWADCSDTTIDCHCNSLFALELANAHGLDSCDDPAVTLPCETDGNPATIEQCTPNAFLQQIYDEPLSQELASGNLPQDEPWSGTLIGVFLPKCLDGTDSCDPGAELRCIDGTRPLYYVDPADDPTSNKWLFTFQGGGSCGRSATETGGEMCGAQYTEVNGGGNFKNRPEMTGWELTNAAGSAAYAGPELMRTVGGIHRDDAASPFADYHRVQISKCSYDRSNGRTAISAFDPTSCPAGHDCTWHKQDPDTGGKPNNTLGDGVSTVGDDFNLQFTGRIQVVALLNHLRAGRTIRDWTRPVILGMVDLPALEDAEQIVFAGHSGGAEGLISNLDDLAAAVHSVNPETEVRGVIDARGWPTLDHEQGLNLPGDMFDQNTNYAFDCIGCLPVSSSGAGQDTSADPFRPGGNKRMPAAYWEMLPDASCTSTFPGIKKYRCYDTGHVLYNHLSTPFFLRQAQQDQKHLGKAPLFATDPAYLWDPVEYQDRVRDQATAFEAERHASPGRFAEPVYGWADSANVGLGLFMPETTVHGGLFSTSEFTGVRMSLNPACVWSRNYEQVLYDWLDPAVGGDQIFVDGVLGGVTCP